MSKYVENPYRKAERVKWLEQLLEYLKTEEYVRELSAWRQGRRGEKP